MNKANKSEYYVNNKELLEEIKESRKNNRITDELAKMMMKMVKKCASAHNWYFYSYNDEMQSEALLFLTKGALKFNPDKSDNPFGYYTTIIQRAFIGYLNKEKQQSRIRDDIIIKSGMLPSWARQEEDLEEQHAARKEKREKDDDE